MRSGMRRTRATLGLLKVTLLASAVVALPMAEAQEIYAGKFPQQTGEDLFRNICQGCHMPDAKGAIGAGAYPALAANPRLAAAIYPISVVLHGQRAMPPFGESLSDEQVANVINYVRTNFGNHYKDTVTPAAVAARRAAVR
jgi:mono/diheme cytochrome c family protein